MSDYDFSEMNDPTFLSEYRRVREAIEALQERFAVLSEEFDRRASLSWQDASPTADDERSKLADADPVARMHLAERMIAIARYWEAAEILMESLTTFREKGDTENEMKGLRLLDTALDVIGRRLQVFT